MVPHRKRERDRKGVALKDRDGEDCCEDESFFLTCYLRRERGKVGCKLGGRKKERGSARLVTATAEEEDDLGDDERRR